MIQSLTLGPLPTDVQQQHERWGGWRWKQQLEGATVGIVRGTAQRILQHTASRNTMPSAQGHAQGALLGLLIPPVCSLTLFFPRFVLWDWKCCLGCTLCSSGTALHSQCKLHIHLHSGTEGENNRIRDGAVVLAPRAKFKWLP